MDGIRFATLHRDGSESNARIVKHSDISACPHVIFMPEHYRDDGSCKCDDVQERAKMIREWGYSKSDF
jgi:hypothetical protein